MDAPSKSEECYRAVTQEQSTAVSERIDGFFNLGALLTVQARWTEAIGALR